MSLLHAILLGAIQGFTEFLPVSSSAHLVVFQNLLGIKEPQLFFDVMLHLGTLVAVLFFFRKDIVGILSSLTGKEIHSETSWSGGPNDGKQIVLWIILGTIPAVFVGLFLKGFIEKTFESASQAGFDLLITGAILVIADRFRNNSRKAASLGLSGALIVGIAQAIAILPGISRSGATICAALFLGVERKEAGRFSFLLSVPAILGATILESKDAIEAGISLDISVIAGTLVALLTGLFALRWLIRVLSGGKLLGFAVYCWIFGIFTIIGSFTFLK